MSTETKPTPPRSDVGSSALLAAGGKVKGKLNGRLPDPTPEQSACHHARWRAMDPAPRVCPECLLWMWDAGD